MRFSLKNNVDLADALLAREIERQALEAAKKLVYLEVVASVIHRPNGRANTLCSGWPPKIERYRSNKLPEHGTEPGTASRTAETKG